MYRIVVLVLCYHALSQPVSNELAPRLARELVECCPCPPGARDGQPWLADGSQLARAVGVDDCPCRPRGADSEGAPSVFFPAALRPDGSHLSPNDPKEDPKNILEPEVALAASVLDTLREVTEQEYQDALEREAARNAAEPDAVPEESARNVVIVLNPKDSYDDDDFISEASHVHESRCIHPTGSSLLTKMRSSANPIHILPELFQLPKLKHLRLPHKNLPFDDSNVGASDLEKSVIDTGKEVKFSSGTTGLKHTKPLKSSLRNQHDSFILNKPNLHLGKDNDNNSLEGFKLSLVPELNSRTNIVDDDLSSASSNVKPQSKPTTDKINGLFKNDKLPRHLQNLLKLRDVELIPNTIRRNSWPKPKLDMSKFAIPTLFNSNTNKMCNDAPNFSSNVVFNPVHKDLEEENKEDDDANDTKTDRSTIDNSDKFQNNVEHSMPELNTALLKMNADSIISKNMNKNEAMEDKQTNLDASTSPSQVQLSIIKNNSEKKAEAVASPARVSDCNTLELKKSDISIELKEVQDEPLEIDSDSVHFGNANVATENISNLNEDTEGSDFSQDQNINTEESSLRINENQDSETDSSNIILSSLLPLEKPETTVNESDENQRNTAIDNEFVEVREGNSMRNMIPQVKEIPPLSETLSNLRVNVVKQLENFKKPSIKPELFKTVSVNNYEYMNIDNEREVNTDCISNQMTKSLNPTNTVDTKTVENVSDISMNDLQNMSNKLLDSNLNDQENIFFIESTESNPSVKTDFKSNEINDNNSIELKENEFNTIDIDRAKLDAGDGSFTSNREKENECPTNLESKNAEMSEEKNIKSATQDRAHKEMDTGASDTVINTVPRILDSLNPNLKLRSPLLSDMVLQPSIDPLNLLSKPLGDVFSLNTNLPTLDDLRERLANFFNTDDESVENDPSSLEAHFTNYSPSETMAPEASTRNSHNELPLFQQLEVLNNNIIQKKPKISSPLDTLMKSRLVDLNSYRAHLPSPNSLNLKALPIEPRPQSRADKKKPTFNFIPDRTLLRKDNPSGTFPEPLANNLPTLDELSNTLRLSAKNLLNNPIHSDFNLLPEKLRSHEIEDVAKNVRLNTEKTLKGIQRKMKSSLRHSKLQNPLGDSLAKPQELLDDMNDRLQGLHYDLNDRLSTIRENILDSSKIKTLVDQPRKASNRNVMTYLQKPKTKSSTPRLHSAASTLTNQELNPHSLRLEPRNNVHPDSYRSYKTQKVAESSPFPATVEMPKSVNPPLFYSHKISPPHRQKNPTMPESVRQRTPTTFLNNKDITHFKDNVIKSPLFKSAVSPFNNQRQPNTFKITFGTTTAKPILPSRPVNRVPNMSAAHLEENIPGSTSLDTIANSNVQTGKFEPFRTSAPVPSPIDEEFEDTLKQISNEDLSPNTKLKSSVLREMSKPFQVHTNTNKFKSAHLFDDKIKNHGSKFVEKTSPWPKLAENGFSSKIKDAANIKKVDGVSKAVKDKTEQLDMLRSPTENTGIVMDEPLKENVSYRCRMVCTKEIK